MYINPYIFFECPCYVALRNNLFTSVAQHTDYSLQMAIASYCLEITNKGVINLMPCSTLLPYHNALTDPLMRWPIAPHPFNRPSLPSPATQQASRAHDKRDLYNTCNFSQLSRNKYCKSLIFSEFSVFYLSAKLKGR